MIEVAANLLISFDNFWQNQEVFPASLTDGSKKTRIFLIKLSVSPSDASIDLKYLNMMTALSPGVNTMEN